MLRSAVTRTERSGIRVELGESRRLCCHRAMPLAQAFSRRGESKRRGESRGTPLPAAGALAGVPAFDQMSLPLPYADTRSV